MKYYNLERLHTKNADQSPINYKFFKESVRLGLTRTSSDFAGYNITRPQTQALLRTPVLRLTTIHCLLKIFPEEFFGDDEFVELGTHVSSEPLHNNNVIVQFIFEFER